MIWPIGQHKQILTGTISVIPHSLLCSVNCVTYQVQFMPLKLNKNIAPVKINRAIMKIKLKRCN